MGKLTATKVKALTEPGTYMDGDGLMLVVTSKSSASWKLRAMVAGKRRDIGLGSLKVLSLAEARDRASDLRRQIAQGIDPIAERKKIADPVPTFSKAAASVHEEHKAAWKNGKHQYQWINTLTTYPTIYTDYRVLLAHPRERTFEYREGQTKGSSLFPLLSLWASTFGEGTGARFLSEFAEQELRHCNMQFWLAGADSEDLLYSGGRSHGASLGGVPITADGERAMRMLEAECASPTGFENLSAISRGHWPVLTMACRHAGLPLPPDLWLGLLWEARSANASDANIDGNRECGLR